MQGRDRGQDLKRRNGDLGGKLEGMTGKGRGEGQRVVSKSPEEDIQRRECGHPDAGCRGSPEIGCRTQGQPVPGDLAMTLLEEGWSRGQCRGTSLPCSLVVDGACGGRGIQGGF